jgi:hypothetical protein
MIIFSQEPTLSELETQSSEESECEARECIEQELEDCRFLRRALNAREDGLRKQLAQLKIENQPKPINGYNGTSQPICPDGSEADGL